MGDAGAAEAGSPLRGGVATVLSLPWFMGVVLFAGELVAATGRWSSVRGVLLPVIVLVGVQVVLSLAAVHLLWKELEPGALKWVLGGLVLAALALVPIGVLDWALADSPGRGVLSMALAPAFWAEGWPQIGSGLVSAALVAALYRRWSGGRRILAPSPA